MDNLSFGLWITLFGMGTVFLLLLVLMLVLRLIGWEPRKQSLSSQSPTVDESNDTGVSPELVAAIMVGVAAYRNPSLNATTRVREIKRRSDATGWSISSRIMQHHSRQHRQPGG